MWYVRQYGSTNEEATKMAFIKKIIDGFKTKNQEQNYNILHENLSILEVEKKLKRSNELANIANKTTDRDEFYRSINEIKGILRELSKYEGELPFIGSPSADLRNLERMEKSQIELLEKRIEESQEEQEKNYLYPRTKNCAYDEPTIFTLKENGNIEENIILEKDRETDNTFRKETICIKRKNIVIDGLDTYFVEAGMFVIDKDKASIGMIQRVFKIGFNRAVRIMDQLAQAGVVGEEEGTKPRKILMSMDMFTQYIEECEECQSTQKESGIEELSPVDVAWCLKDRFNIDIEYLNDGKALKNLRNIIIPSETDEKQIEIINILLKFNSPKTMNLILIDDSVINYSIYNGVPQLLIPVITDKNKIDSIADWCYAEMRERINKFIDNRVKNIDSFNKKTAENTLPRIICIVNEANEFLKYISTPLERLFMNSNMVGIYFILFSRFSLKSLSLGIIGELLEVSTADKLKILLSKNESANYKQSMTRNFDDMGGHQFEHFCADILRKNGFENVEVTQGSGDHGIDILAEKDDITYAIQCKRYDKPIGNDAVQQAIAGKGFYHRDIAVVMTNRNFTPQAIEEAKALGVKLWDRDRLNKMIGRGKIVPVQDKDGD